MSTHGNIGDVGGSPIPPWDQSLILPYAFQVTLDDRSKQKERLMASYTVVGRVIVVTFGLLFAGGCANDKKVMAGADTMHSGLQPAVMNDPELQGYLQKVGERIVQTAAEM